MFCFYFLFSLKAFCFILITKYTTFGNTKDSEYYHAMALKNEVVTNAVNYWPVILNFLNRNGMYDREIVNGLIFIISGLVIPLLIAKIITSFKTVDNVNKKYFWIIAIVVSLYPTIFVLSLDITRDIPMLLIFLIDILLLRCSLENKNYFIKGVFTILFISLSIHLYDWREYLGISLIVSYFILILLSLKRITSPMILFFYMVCLVLFYKVGLLDPILSYRGAFGFEHGNSSIGIGLINKSWIEFILLYLYSVFLQFFGFHLVNVGAVFLFILESLPVIMLLIFLEKNKSIIGGLEKYLLIFCLVYLTVWGLGNDNIGTAMRLRIFNYIAIFISAYMVFLKKKTYKI